jgi:hypothetical protein
LENDNNSAVVIPVTLGAGLAFLRPGEYHLQVDYVA